MMNTLRDITSRTHNDADLSKQALTTAVRDLLGGSLGLQLYSRVSPKVAGLTAAALYACVPCIYLAQRAPTGLIVLSCWHVLYFGLAAALTRSTGPWVEETVETLVVPVMSSAAARSALTDIETNFRRSRLALVSTLTSMLFVALTWWFLRKYDWRHLILLGISCSYLYFTATFVTLTSKFHLCFCRAIKQNPDQLFIFDPASSPVIVAARTLSNRLLRYWLCIFIIVTTMALVPPIVRQVQPREGDILQVAVWVSIAIAGFFSFIYGSLAYLRFESDLRNAVDQVRLQTMVALQEEYAKCFEAPVDQPATGASLDNLRNACDVLRRGELTRTAGSAIIATTVALLPAIASLLAALATVLRLRQTSP